MFWIELRLTFKRNGDGCMRGSPHSKVSSLLPRLHHWVPGQDRGEVVIIIITTGNVEDSADMVWYGSSWPSPWWRKLSALHLPPLQLGATWVGGHLVVKASLSIFLMTSKCEIGIWISKQWKLIVSPSLTNLPRCWRASCQWPGHSPR